MPFRHRAPGPSIGWALALLVSGGCGDDGPTQMEGDGGGGGALGDLIAAAAPGDTVRIALGDHAVGGTITIAATQTGLVIVGREAIGRGPSSRPVLVADVDGGAVFDVLAEDVTIRGVAFEGTFADGVVARETGLTVVDCRIEGAAQDAISFASPGPGVATRNVLVDAGRFGVRCAQVSRPDLSFNTIVGAGDCGIYTLDADATIRGNIIYGSVQWGVACFGNTLPILSCNVIDESGTSSYSPSCAPGKGDIESDPLFCEGESYAVQEDSPCVTGDGCGWIGAVRETCPVPQPSLADQIDEAAPGDTVFVNPGVEIVDAAIVIGAAKTGLVVMGRELPARDTSEGDDRPTLLCDVGATAVFTVEATGVTIAGLEIQGSFRDGVVVRAEGSTVSDCWIEGASRYAISFPVDVGGTVSRNVLLSPGVFGVHCTIGSEPTIGENTIVGSLDCGIYTLNAAPSIVANAIFESVNYGVACFGSPVPTMSCNVIDQSGTSNYSGACAPGADDVEMDPLFCDDGTYAVMEASPCLPGETCGWVGAVQATCETRRTPARVPPVPARP